MFLENIAGPMFKTFQQSAPALMDEILNDSKKSPEVQDQMKKKYSTFVGFSFREAYHQAKQKKKRRNQQAKLLETDLGAMLQLFMQNSLITGESKPQTKGRNSSLEQLPGIKSERRERFRKGVNTFLIIKHYIQRQNFKPTQQQMYLMRQLAQMKQLSDENNLDSLQQKVYKLMNEAVDFNEVRFLSLLVILAADISFSFKDMSRSFFFYNQARIFATYSQLYHIKIEALKQMGLIALQQKLYKQSIILLKKALQYAWKIKNTEMQILIYDYLGEVFYYEGEMRQSQYYHKRFSQGESENMDSAVRRLSSEMLNEYLNHLKPMEKQRLTSLFLQYIQLPIVGHQIIPPPPNYGSKIYPNFNEDGQSPRKKRASRRQTFQDYQSVQKQIQNLLQLDFEFATTIPNPDVQKNFISTQKFGRPRKLISFQQSAQCHKLTHKTLTKLDLKQLQINNLQKRLEKAFTSRPNEDWWLKIKDKIKNNQKHMVGKVKDRIYNSHQSYYKYPEQRRRAQSLRSQKIKQSFNKTLLDWIDPLK